MPLIILLLLVGAPQQSPPADDAVPVPASGEAAPAENETGNRTGEELTRVLGEINSDHPKAKRLAALKRLLPIAEKDPERVSAALVPLLKEEDSEIRGEAHLALGMAMFGQECPLAIVEALHDKDDHVRHQAVVAFGMFTKYAAAAGPLIIAAAESKDHYVRQNIPFALRHLGKSDEVLTAMKRLCRDGNSVVAGNAHLYHFEITSDANFYVGYLLRETVGLPPKELAKLNQDQKEEHKFNVYLAATKIYNLMRDRPLDLAHGLSHHLKHDDPRIRQCALRQFRTMCTVSKSSFRSALKVKPHQQLKSLAADDPDEGVRLWASVVLELLKAGPPADAPQKLQPLPTIDMFEQPAEADDSSD